MALRIDVITLFPEMFVGRLIPLSSAGRATPRCSTSCISSARAHAADTPWLTTLAMAAARRGEAFYEPEAALKTVHINPVCVCVWFGGVAWVPTWQTNDQQLNMLLVIHSWSMDGHGAACCSGRVI